MKLNLNTWQRVTLAQIVGSVRGDAATIHKAGHLWSTLDLSEDERGEVGFVQNPQGAIYWEDAEHRWSLEVNDKEQVRFLKEQVEAFDGWPASQYLLVEDIFNQLGIEVNDG